MAMDGQGEYACFNVGMSRLLVRREWMTKSDGLQDVGMLDGHGWPRRICLKHTFTQIIILSPQFEYLRKYLSLITD